MEKTRREFLGIMGVTIGTVALLGACTTESKDEKCPTCGKSPCVCPPKCPVCGKETCVCPPKCPVCGKETCVCPPVDNKCPVCGKETCVCPPSEVDQIAEVIPKSGLNGCQACSGSARYCVPACTYGALTGTTFEIPPVVNPDLCTGCGDCVKDCIEKSKKNGIRLIPRP